MLTQENACSRACQFAITHVAQFLAPTCPRTGGIFMDAALQAQLTYAALGCSVVALFFSIIAAFPGLKGILAAVRDGILWFALLLVLGGVGFLVWQRLHLHERAPVAKAAQAPG
jgi:hypothetical protein